MGSFAFNLLKKQKRINNNAFRQRDFPGAPGAIRLHARQLQNTDTWENGFNSDNKYNALDPVMLYLSDLNGKNFKQITAPNEQFIDYIFYPKTDKILIKTIIDSDSNKTFTNFDETNFVEMKISDPDFGKEIFSKSLKDSLRIQINAK